MDRIKETAQKIQWYVADDFKITAIMLLRKSRKPKYCYPRMFAMYFIREVTGKSFPWIAKLFNVHHTSVIHACDWAEAQRRDNEDYRAYIERRLINFKEQRDAMDRKNLPQAQQEAQPQAIC